MLLRIFKIALLSVIIFTPIFFILAQDDPVQEKIALEEELAKLEEDLKKIDQDITKTEKDKKTLQSQVSLLKQKIAKLNLQIKQSNAMIKDLGIQIKDTESSIIQTSSKIDDSRKKLAVIMRTVWEENQTSLAEIMLFSDKLSDFFDNLMYLEKLNSKNQELLKNIKDLKIYLEGQKESLDSEKIDLEKVVKMQILQKQQNEADQKEKDNFLKLTEAQYQKQLQDKKETQKMAAEIRARIFEIIGVPQAPTFGEAYALAKEIEKTTGVRPAFLLAVLTQESNIGKNVGQCYLRNKETGDGVAVFSGNTVKKIMKPNRDVQPFLTITQELGRDPYNTPVSCPIPSVGGYGGAMGPAQFISPTWMAYRDRIQAITGKTPDPWDIKDSFLAAALYLSDYGAKSQTASQEWRAAMIYFSGSTNKRYRFYGDSVAAIAKKYEIDIKALI
ncbi:MAG: lytic murein transglycosylase [Patescibacteria group bacterium]